MWEFLLSIGMMHLLAFALHVVDKGSFPKPLPAEEEKALLARMRAGDTAARERLILHNLRLVAHIAKKYYATGKEPDDLISIGTIGLIKGINTFDPDKNIKLATYASRCIENEILMSLRAEKKIAQDVFLNDPIDFDSAGNPLTLLDIVAEDGRIDETIDWKIKAESLRRHFDAALTPREKQILTQRYGLDGKDEMTQLQIAKQLGISRSYVSRIEKKALHKIRAAYERRERRP